MHFRLIRNPFLEACMFFHSYGRSNITQHAGCMEIVTTGMHHAVVFRGVGQACFLTHRQGENITPQAQHSHAVGPNRGDCPGIKSCFQETDPVFPEDSLQPRGRFVFLLAQFRMSGAAICILRSVPSYPYRSPRHLPS